MGDFFPDIQLSIYFSRSPTIKTIGGSFKYFLFSPRKLGQIPILTSILFRWVGSTTNQLAKSSPCSFVSLSTRSTHRLLGRCLGSLSHNAPGGLDGKGLGSHRSQRSFCSPSLGGKQGASGAIRRRRLGRHGEDFFPLARSDIPIVFSFINNIVHP